MAEKEGRKELFRALADPPEEFTPVPFWFLNDRPDQEKIAEQLKDIKAKGVDAIVLHPRIGIPEDVPYLSDAWFRTVRFIVKCADALGIKIVHRTRTTPPKESGFRTGRRAGR